MYIKLERSNIKKLLCYSDHCVLPGNCSGAFSFGSMPFVSLVFDYGSYGRFLLFLFGIRKLLEESQLLFCLLLLLLSRILIVWKLPFYIQCFSIHWCFFFFIYAMILTSHWHKKPNSNSDLFYYKKASKLYSFSGSVVVCFLSMLEQECCL